MNAKKTLKIIYLIVSVCLAISSIYMYVVLNGALKIEKDPLLGNKPTVINKLKSDNRSPFSFAFISDTENNDDSLRLIKAVLKEKIDFLVFVGDFVNKPRHTEHKLFLRTISKSKPKIPVFLVPGNHDVALSLNDKQEGVFTISDFRKLYGPDNFYFEYNNCFFIFLENISSESSEYLDYLNTALLNRGKDTKYTFVFFHVPSDKIKCILKKSQLSGGRLEDIAANQKIDYIICGDYHRRLEFNDNSDTKYIVSGSGGAHYHGNTPWGRFRSATKITVYEDGILEELLVDKNTFTLTDNSIRHFLYDNLINIANSSLLKIIVLILLINALFSIFFCRGFKLK